MSRRRRNQQFLPTRSGAEFRKHLAMADIRFAVGDMDRRRRLMSSEIDADADEETKDADGAKSGDLNGAAFRLLSRDRLIRRVISPRLWKNWLVAGILIGSPWLLVIARVCGVVGSGALWPVWIGVLLCGSVVLIDLLGSGGKCLRLSWWL
jgi:hypothetical protein